MQGPEILFINTIPSIVQSIKTKFPSYQYLILTDEHLALIHLPPFKAEMEANDMRFITYILPSGELNKSHDSIVKVQDFMFTNHFNRTDIVIALGGGLITDFGGFLSSIYMRGVAFINVPTTLLSMVDASVGSKTAINTKFGKNLIGAFYDSKAIYINVNFLKTLDDRNFSNGFAEIIKASLLLDKSLFEKLEKCNVRDLKLKDHQELENIIKRSIDIKLFFVLKDKKDSHLRQLLNLGHTLGHGIEYALHEELLHGECVSIGILKMIEIGIRKKIIDETVGYELYHRVKNIFEKYYLTINVPSELNLKNVLMNMMSDKKNKAQEIRFVFIKDIGVYHEKSVAIEIPLILEVLSNKIHPTRCLKPSNDYEPDTIGSKSITNRLIFMGSLGEGTMEIDNYLVAEDTEVLMEALKKLSLCDIIEQKKNTLILKGINGNFQEIERNKELVIDIANSGLTARFLIGLLSFIPGTFILTGNEYMKKRPMGDLIEAIKNNSTSQILFLEKENCLPIKIINNKDAKLKGGDIYINSKISSQYVSTLLICAPYASLPVTIHLQDLKENEEITSEPFIEMTINLMKVFGVEVKKVSYNSFYIPSGKFKNPTKFNVEPDFSTLTSDLVFVSLFGGNMKIKNIPNSPLQNDANFPAEILTKIGIEVISLPKENQIIVKRDIKKKLIPIEVNLNKYTDCFLAFAIIASQIQGVTTITGIANQRMKECNRIKTVCHNLIKCGIFCHEIPDGLKIYGKSLEIMNNQHIQKKKILIETCNDHRIAMVFSILASYFEQIKHPLKLVIDNKNCVVKTFPEYFSHLQKSYGMQFEGELTWNEKNCDFDNENEIKNYLNQNYLIIIGMRGVGKSSTAKLIERKMGWRSLDLDEIVLERFMEKHPETTTLKEIIMRYGWKLFRDYEKLIFNEYIKKVVEKELTDCVIACGGGVIEDIDNYELLRMMENVIWIEHNDIDEVEQIVNGQNQPNYENESFKEVYEKRKKMYNQASKYILCVPSKKETDENNILMNYYHKTEKMKYKQIDYIFNNDNNKFLLKENTFFLCISLETVDQLKKDDYFYIRNNYTALEITISDFVVNMLSNNLIDPKPEDLDKIIEKLRHKIAKTSYFLVNFEIIITLRTEGRKFDMSEYVYNYILNELSKCCFNMFFDCEYRATNLAFLNSFALKHQNIIISKHFFDANVTDDSMMKEFEKMHAFAGHNFKSVKLFKFILSSACTNSFIEDVRNKASSLPMPHLIFKLGFEGRYSRLEAKVYLPVFDSKIMKPVIEGQLQKSDVINLRRELYIDNNAIKKFYVISNNVFKSFSPKIHNYFFEKSGLMDHLFDFKNVENEDDLAKIFKEKDFSGASITIPYKKTVIPLLDFIYSEAKEIGVVNTIVKSQNKLYGFNTDCHGIFNTINDKINELKWHHLKKSDNIKKYVLILGAGATAETAFYTFSKMMNFQVLIYNRSNSRFVNFSKKGLKNEHMFCNPEDFEKFYNAEILNNSAEIVIIFNTIPSDGVIPMLNKFNNNVLKNIFTSRSIASDCAYVPKNTNFLKIAQDLGSQLNYGADFFLHQAHLQAKIFCQKEFNFDVIKNYMKI